MKQMNWAGIIRSVGKQPCGYCGDGYDLLAFSRNKFIVEMGSILQEDKAG